MSENPTFLQEEPLPKITKRRESHKDRRSSIDKPSTSKEVKPVSVEKRRKSIISTENEPVTNGKNHLSEINKELEIVLPPLSLPIDQIRPPLPESDPICPPLPESDPICPPLPESDPIPPPLPESDPIHHAPTGLKRKVDEIASSPPKPSNESHVLPEKHRQKFDIHQAIKRIKPLPKTKKIEDTFTPSQLPPPLDVVPEAKEPEYKHKLFNKKKNRVAHGKVLDKGKGSSKEKDKEREKPKKKEVEKKKELNLDVRKKQGEKYTIPKTIQSRESRSSSDDMQSFLDKIDEATNEDSVTSVSNKENQKNIPTRRLSQSENRNQHGVNANNARPPVNPGVHLDWSNVSLSTNCPPPLNQNTPHVFAIPKTPARNPVVTHRVQEVPPSPFLDYASYASTHKDPRIQSGPISHPIAYDCKNILKDVLSWNVNWIGEENAPVVKNISQLSSVTNTFQSYAHYVK